MTTRDHERASMLRALSVATRGPAIGVNPQVGCVILSPDGDVLAEGWHRGSGTAHAEIDALSRLDAEAARGATVVVTLEPCDHLGRTGPCSEALIAAGVGRVVFAVTDPGERSGGGAARLRAAGIEVEGGLLADDAERLLHAWLTAERLGRPYVTLKWAATLDGRVAATDGTSRWITGTAARQRVHEQREANDAILVGTGTVLADDPSLTARGDAGELMPHQPIPIVVGERDIPVDAAVRRHPQPVVQTRSRDLPAILARLFAGGIRHAFVEGGPTLATALVRADLVDEYAMYLAPTLLGGPGLALHDIGVQSIDAARRLRIDSVEQLGDDLLVTARPREVAPQRRDARPRERTT